MKKNKKKLYFISIIILISLILFIYLISILKQKKELKLKIGDVQITNEELEYAINAKKSEVSNYFTKEYGAKVDREFWNKDFLGKKPIDLLYDASIEYLKKLKSVYILAKENGDVDSESFESIVYRKDYENATRKKAIEKGEVVYGLSNFSLDTFLAYEMDAMEKNYIKKNEDKFKISDDEIKKFYDENKENYFKKNDALKFSYIRFYHSINEKLSKEETERINKQIEEIAMKVKSGKNLSDIIADYPEVKPYYQTLDLTSDLVGSYTRHIGDVLEVATKTKKGESVLEKNELITIFVQMIDRTDFKYVPIEEVKDVIVKDLREKKYNNLIEEKIKSLNVSHDKESNINIIKKYLN